MMNKENIKKQVYENGRKSLEKIESMAKEFVFDDITYVAIPIEDESYSLAIDSIFEETYSLCSAEPVREVKNGLFPLADDEIVIKFDDLTAMRNLAVDIEEVITKNKIKSDSGNQLMKVTNRIFHQSAARTQENDEELVAALDDEEEKLRSFECPSCGSIQKSTEEPKGCSCGRRGGFKEITGDENE